MYSKLHAQFPTTFYKRLADRLSSKLNSLIAKPLDGCDAACPTSFWVCICGGGEDEVKKEIDIQLHVL